MSEAPEKVGRRRNLPAARRTTTAAALASLQLIVANSCAILAASRHLNSNPFTHIQYRLVPVDRLGFVTKQPSLSLSFFLAGGKQRHVNLNLRALTLGEHNGSNRTIVWHAMNGSQTSQSGPTTWPSCLCLDARQLSTLTIQASAHSMAQPL